MPRKTKSTHATHTTPTTPTRPPAPGAPPSPEPDYKHVLESIVAPFWIVHRKRPEAVVAMSQVLPALRDDARNPELLLRAISVMLQRKLLANIKSMEVACGRLMKLAESVEKPASKKYSKYSIPRQVLYLSGLQEDMYALVRKTDHPDTIMRALKLPPIHDSLTELYAMLHDMQQHGDEVDDAEFADPAYELYVHITDTKGILQKNQVPLPSRTLVRETLPHI